ncbi:ADP-ribosylation factor-like protein 14 [Lampris incognitus]|uniref:ADP-ribosylation factor-like protein 14 n=1 Tax=Lampris incognitus TaxID=2546036 RepID=UPI0024B50481|nr:ADP-ribosylation factor-like protein 14 [Lampris incognitus]
MGTRGSKQPEEVRVLLLGLDNAGKSTLLYKAKYDSRVTTVPTVGFNVEMMESRRDAPLTVWDVGGQRGMRRHWRSFYQDTAAVAFVVDSSDPRRLDEARRALERVLASDQLRGRPLLVLANKQDVDGALTVTELTERLKLRKVCAGRDWFVQPCSAATGFGLREGFERVTRLLSSDSHIVRNTLRLLPTPK